MDTALGQAIGSFLQELLTLIILAFLPILLNEIRKGIGVFVAKMKTQVRAEDLQTLSILARIFVTAAEQSGLSDAVLTTGAQKKAEVMQKLQAAADEKHINVSLSTLSSIIESVVWESLGWEKRMAEAGIVRSPVTEIRPID